MTNRILLLLVFVLSFSVLKAQDSLSCTVPTGLFASTRDTSVSLNWKSAGTNVAYTIQYKLRTEANWKVLNATTNSLYLTGLKTCSEYQFRVKSICSMTSSSTYSETKTFKTMGCTAPCNSPKELKVTTGDSKASIKWASSGSLAYEVQYQEATSNNGTWVSARSTTNNFSVVSLKPCTKYSFRVRSICSGSTTNTPVLFSEWSAAVTMATTGCAVTRCEAPRSVRVQVTASGVTVKWDSLKAVSYDIQVKSLNDSMWRSINGVRNNVYTFLAGLASCTVYEVRVRVNCSATTSGVWSYPVRFATLGCQQPICFVPRGLAATVSDSVVVLSWAGAQTSKYVLQYKADGEVNWKTINVAGNVHKLNGLARCKKYSVRIQSVCSSSLMSEFSEIMTFQTGGCTTVECVTPRQLTVKVIDSLNAAYLSWLPTGARAYVIEMKNLTSITTEYRIDTVTAANYTIKNLARCAKYAVQVRAVCNNRMTEPSEVVYFSTAGCVEQCVIPIGLKAEIIGDTSAALYWAATDLAAKFEIQYRVGADSIWKTVTAQGSPFKVNLDRCKIYAWRVRKICSNGAASDWSEVFKFETKGCIEPCVIPTGLKFEVSGDSSAYLGWMGAVGKYEIQFQNRTDSTWKSVFAQDLFLKLPLLRCQVYRWRVRKVCVGGVSDWSEIKEFETRCPEPCALPLDLRTEVIDTNVVLYWTGALGKYEVQYRLGTDSTWKTLTTQGSGYQLTLKPCQLYYWRVRNLCATNPSDWSPIFKFETRGCVEPCVIPTGLKSEIISDSIATLAWLGSTAGTIGKYEVQIKIGNDSTWKSITTQDVIVKLPLGRCQVYSWRVRRICANGMSDWSEIFKFETRGCVEPCVIPTGLKSEIISDSIATLAWLGSTAGTIGKYEVQIKIGNDSTWKSITTQDVIVKLPLGRCQVYSWRVRRICANGMSDWSEIFKFETRCPQPCAIPMDLKAEVIDSNVVLYWGGALGKYEVQYRVGTDTLTKSFITQGSGYQLALKPCQAYYWRVRNLCTDNSSEWSAINKFETKGCPTLVCEKPTSPKATVNQDTIVVLTWVGGPGKYEIQYRAGNDSAYTTLTTTISEAKLVLNRCKDYFWRVRRICDFGTSDWSEITVFATGACPVFTCEIPTGLAAKVTKDTAAVLSWTGVNASSYYELQYRIAGIGIITDWTTVPLNMIGHTLSGLRRCIAYEWRVRRMCTSTSGSDWSPIMRFETTGCAANLCSAPLNVTVSQSVDFASVIWTDVPAGDSVFVEYYKSGDSLGTKLVGTTPNGVMIRAIQACTEYKVKVYRRCSNGGFSTAVLTTFKTIGANCFAGDEVSNQLKMPKTSVKNVAISPNPGDDYVQVQYDLNESADIKIQMLNLQGQVVKQLDGGMQEMGTYSQQLNNMSEINQGMYFIVIRANDRVMTTQKWMKQ